MVNDIKENGKNAPSTEDRPRGLWSEWEDGCSSGVFGDAGKPERSGWDICPFLLRMPGNGRPGR